MRFVTRPLGIIQRALRPYLLLNGVIYGSIIAGLAIGAIVPGVTRGAFEAMSSLVDVSPAKNGTLSAMGSGDVSALIVIIFVANVAFGVLGMAVLPSLLIPFSGIVIHVAFAVLLGLTYAPNDGWGLLLQHIPTLLIEMQAYVVALVGAYRVGILVIAPEREGLRSRAAGYVRGLHDLAWLLIPAAALLLLGAVYESFEVIALMK